MPLLFVHIIPAVVAVGLVLMSHGHEGMTRALISMGSMMMGVMMVILPLKLTILSRGRKERGGRPSARALGISWTLAILAGLVASFLPSRMAMPAMMEMMLLWSGGMMTAMGLSYVVAFVWDLFDKSRKFI